MKCVYKHIKDLHCTEKYADSKGFTNDVKGECLRKLNTEPYYKKQQQQQQTNLTFTNYLDRWMSGTKNQMVNRCMNDNGTCADHT